MPNRARSDRPAKTPFDELPRWPDAAHAMLPGAHQARSDDDDEDDDDDDIRKRKKRKKVNSGDDAATAAGVAAGAAAGAAGLGIGMILLIVGGLFACCICIPGI